MTAQDLDRVPRGALNAQASTNGPESLYAELPSLLIRWQEVIFQLPSGWRAIV